jgi:hypothetical protein
MRYITLRRLASIVLSLALAAGALGVGSGSAVAVAPPTYGPGSRFYTYTGTTPLAYIPPGTVLASRTLDDYGFYYVTPVTVVQLLYRSTGPLGQPTTNLTSVLLPTTTQNPTEAVSDQTAYDSLNPMDEPSVALSEGRGYDAGNVGQYLTAGIAVVMTDTEGQTADLAVGHEYGMNTIDAIRAATSSALTGLSARTKIVLAGYSGGAYATEWAVQLAPSYAPDVNRQLIGAAEGGLPVDAKHVADYISGSGAFTGELPLALIGMGRAYGVDFRPYLSARGRQLYDSLQTADLGSTIYAHPGLTAADLFLPEYANPDSIPAFVAVINRENLGLVPPTSIPLFAVQGGNGFVEGVQPQPPSIGDGDGASVTGNVRTLMRQACTDGVPVAYHEYDGDDHIVAAAVWTGDFGESFGAPSWIMSRFTGTAAPDDCATIAPGNSLAAERVVPTS